jgi:hypothetical protein
MISVKCDICNEPHAYYSAKYATLEIKYYQRDVDAFHFCVKDCAPTPKEIGDYVTERVAQIKKQKLSGEELT